MNDIKNFYVYEKELEQAEKEEREKNIKMLINIEKGQVGRDDTINELMVFANQQLDI